MRRAFTLDDKEIFLGRAREAYDLCTLWRDSSLVVLHSQAGSGKTSLLQAGAAPLLTEDGDVLPLGRALAASGFPEPLLAAHNPFTFAVLASWSPLESRTSLAQKSITSFLRDRVRTLHQSNSSPLLFVAIDQLEEILIDDWSGQDRDSFFADLATALSTIPELRLLLATRTDTLGELAPYERQLLPDGAAHVVLAPLTPKAAAEAIQCPMERAGHHFPPETVEYLVNELMTDQPDNPISDDAAEVTSIVQPVQLQVVCAELWRAMLATHRTATVGFVRDSIDVDCILARFCAEAILESSARHQVRARQIFEWLGQRLISPDGSRVSVPQAAVPEISGTATAINPAVLRTLENLHILTVYFEAGARYYRLANDRLAKAVFRGSRPEMLESGRRFSAAERMRNAESALAAGDLMAARRNAEEALENADAGDITSRADTQSLLGNIAYRGDREDLAEQHYRRAAELREQLGDTRRVGLLLGAVGCMHARQGRFVAAIDELSAAVARIRTDMTLQTELATVLWQAGHTQAAAAVFGAVLTVEPESVTALAGRGQILSERGNASAALADLATLQRLQPAASLRPEVRSAYALALARSGRPGHAMAEADAALATARDSGVIFLRAADVARAGGAFDRAVELLHRAEEASDPALSSDQLARVHHLRDEMSEFDTSVGR